MTYLRLAIAILLAACAQRSYADSIPTFQVTQVTMFMGPNDGSGDNIGFSFTGPGLTITGIAGMGCASWCSGDPVPQDTVFLSQIFITSFNTVILAGQSADPFTLDINPFDEFGGLNARTTGFVSFGTGLVQFNMTMPTDGSWALNLVPTTDLDGNPAVSFVSGSFSASATFVTPEPATISLVFSGLAGIGWITHRKGRFPR